MFIVFSVCIQQNEASFCTQVSSYMLALKKMHVIFRNLLHQNNASFGTLFYVAIHVLILQQNITSHPEVFHFFLTRQENIER